MPHHYAGDRLQALALFDILFSVFNPIQMVLLHISSSLPCQFAFGTQKSYLLTSVGDITQRAFLQHHRQNPEPPLWWYLCLLFPLLLLHGTRWTRSSPPTTNFQMIFLVGAEYLHYCKPGFQCKSFSHSAESLLRDWVDLRDVSCYFTLHDIHLKRRMPVPLSG